jgi:hypothetical protein
MCLFQVLPAELTWADFDYEAIEGTIAQYSTYLRNALTNPPHTDLCKDAICRDDATCNPLSGTACLCVCSLLSRLLS